MTMLKHFAEKISIRFQGQNQPTRSVSSVSAVTPVAVYSLLVLSKTQKITVTECTQQTATQICNISGETKE